MNSTKITRLSKTLSWLLRHAASAEGLVMDPAGWVCIDDVLRYLQISRDTLDDVVHENNKSRLQVEGNSIRCCQGHSLKGTPVTLDALEASWEIFQPTGSVWHGTYAQAAVAIAREGIVPGERSHVHLAEEKQSKVGKRANVTVLLEVCSSKLEAHGLQLFRSQNGVILARYVPADCIVNVIGITTSGKKSEAHLKNLFRG